MIGRFTDRVRNFAGFTEAKADLSLAVADDDERGETEALAALDGLRNAVDVDELFDQLFAAFDAAGLRAATAATLVAITIAATTATKPRSVVTVEWPAPAATSDPTKIAQANKRAEIQIAEAKAATRKEIEATTNALKAQQDQQRSARDPCLVPDLLVFHDHFQ